MPKTKPYIVKKKPILVAYTYWVSSPLHTHTITSVGRAPIEAKSDTYLTVAIINIK